MLLSDAFEFSKKLSRPETFALSTGSPRSRIQGFRLLVSSVPASPPVEQSLPTDLGMVKHGLQAVLFPEYEDLVSVLGLCGDHIPPAYHFLPAGNEASGMFKLV